MRWLCEEDAEVSGGIDEMGFGLGVGLIGLGLTGPEFGPEEKLGHVPRLRCSEAVREGLEAEKRAEQRAHFSFTALGAPVSGLWTSIGSRWAQYHAPFPFTALVLTITSPSYLLLTARAAASSAVTDAAAGGPSARLLFPSAIAKENRFFYLGMWNLSKISCIAAVGSDQILAGAPSEME